MIPSQLLDNEVFLGCKRRVASCSLSPVFKHPLHQNSERQSCCKFPATSLKPVTLGKTALFHATFTSTMRLLGFGFHAGSILMRKKRAKCSKGNKTQFFMFFFTFCHAFFRFCSCLFHSCLSQRNETRENCDGFLQRGIASLFLDLRLSDKTCDCCQSPFFPCDLAF